MRKIRAILKTVILSGFIALPVLGHGETTRGDKIIETKAKNTQRHKEAVCFGVYLLTFNILQEKYHAGSLEKSQYYNADKNNELKEYFGEEIPDLKKLTQTIYNLPVIEDLDQRKTQFDMVQNLVTASCGLSLHTP